jgi:hypothetical protein
MWEGTGWDGRDLMRRICADAGAEHGGGKRRGRVWIRTGGRWGSRVLGGE